MSRYSCKYWAMLVLSLFCAGFSDEEKVQVPLSVASMIESIETTDLDIGEGKLVFDNDATTLIRTPSINPAFVRVVFKEPITFEHIRLRLIEEKHTISMAAADDRSDLRSRTGSYRGLVTNLETKGTCVEVPLDQPVTGRAFKLEVLRRSGDDYVHIAEWAFCRPGKVDRLVIERVTDRRLAGTEKGTTEVKGPVSKPVNTVVWFRVRAVASGTALEINDDVLFEALDQGVRPFGDVRGQFLVRKAGMHRIRVRYGQFEEIIRVEGLQRRARNREPDVEIWYIERLPRIDYDGPNEGLPNPGDRVIWRGHVYNWGEESVRVRYEWTLDGEQVSRGEMEIPPGLPGINAETIDLPLKWGKERKDLTLTLTPPSEYTDLIPRNNSLTVQTDGITVGFWVEESLWHFHHEHQHRLPTKDANSFAGWSQRMMRQWNKMFAEAVFPEYPGGILERVRLDRLVIVPDFALPLAGGIPSNNPDVRDKTVDMTWGHESGGIDPGGGVVPGTNPPPGSIEHWWSPERALEAFANKDIENRKQDPPFWCGLGYIHEMAHARYLVDAYGFNVHSGTSKDLSERAFMVSDEKGPILGRYMRVEDDIQHWRKYAGQMGGNYWAWSVFEAMCWNRVKGRRARGGNCNAPPNIGEFLQDIPGKLIYAFSDGAGNPLAHAEVRVYQARGDGKNWYGKKYLDEPDMKKETDGRGRVVFDRTLWSEDGRIRHGFGHSNAVALLRITFEGKHYFLFEEVTDANLAYNLGHQDAYTFRRRIKLREGELSPEEWDVNETWEAPGASFGRR